MIMFVKMESIKMSQSHVYRSDLSIEVEYVQVDRMHHDCLKVNQTSSLMGTYDTSVLSDRRRMALIPQDETSLTPCQLDRSYRSLPIILDMLHG